MSDNALLTSKQKEILREEVDLDRYSNPRNTIYKIRSNARSRGESVVEEIRLLEESGNGDVADEIRQTVANSMGLIYDEGAERRIEQLRVDIETIERNVNRIPEIKRRLEKIEGELGIEPPAE